MVMMVVNMLNFQLPTRVVVLRNDNFDSGICRKLICLPS